MFTAILNTGMRDRFAKIEAFGTVFQFPQDLAGYEAIHALQDQDLKREILQAFADSFRVSHATCLGGWAHTEQICWIIGFAVILGALGLTLCTKSYSMDRSKQKRRHAASESVVQSPELSSPVLEDMDEKAGLKPER